MKRIIVLGAGLIGGAIAEELSKKHDVTCADISGRALDALMHKAKLTGIQCDFSNKETLLKLIDPFDLVVLAVPGFMGFETLKQVIAAKKNVVDISFFPEDPFLLDALARKNNVTAVVDCGVAPGLCNIWAGYHHKQSNLLRYECKVGGLPVEATLPFKYKAVFSPIDVLEEYTRPARFRKNGKQVVTDALSEIELISFKETGTLEAFNTDGLRTLAYTMPDVPDMKEKTLRYPGHAALMRTFKDTGLFNTQPVDVEGQKVVPLAVTAKLLFPHWKLNPGDADFTVMQVILEDAAKEITYLLFDQFDPASQTTSMARTTGYTCAAVAELVLNEDFSRKGISPPEYVGAEEGLMNEVTKYLNERNVRYTKKVTLKKSLIKT